MCPLAWVGWPAWSEHSGRRDPVSALRAGVWLAADASVRGVWWRRGPFRGNDRVELGPQQLLIGQQQIQELLLGAARVIDPAATTDLGHA